MQALGVRLDLSTPLRVCVCVASHLLEGPLDAATMTSPAL